MLYGCRHAVRWIILPEDWTTKFPAYTCIWQMDSPSTEAPQTMLGHRKLDSIVKTALVLSLLLFILHTLDDYRKGYQINLFNNSAHSNRIAHDVFHPGASVSSNSSTETVAGKSLQYSWNNTQGRAFPLNQAAALTSIGFPLKEFIRITDESLGDYVFVMAANQRYVGNALEAVATIQEHFPSRKIIFYDLGLEPESRTKIKAVCNMEYRLFNFSKFPNHVRANLKNYSWKLLIIHDVFQEFSGVFWVDSSIRFFNNDTRHAFDKVRETGGISLFIHTGHSNYAVIMPDTASYLTTDMEMQKATIQSGATVMLLYRTKEIYENILKWGVLCSLEEDCIAHGEVGCYFWGQDRWAHCSRFDQTVINILCSNYYGFDNAKYTSGNRLHNNNEMFRVHRFSRDHKHPRYCKNVGTSQMSESIFMKAFLEVL